MSERALILQHRDWRPPEALAESADAREPGAEQLAASDSGVEALRLFDAFWQRARR